MANNFLKMLTLLGAVGCAAAARAAQPPDVVNSDAYGNTAMGSDYTLFYVVPNESGAGESNTAAGYTVLTSTVGGANNTAFGGDALTLNVSGSWNTADGFAALEFSKSDKNTATGAFSLQYNDVGSQNTATGFEALFFNSAGLQNTATGSQALRGNNEDGLSGSFNTANGFQALFSVHTSEYNTASGYLALFADTTGSGNTAVGATAQLSNTTSDHNSAFGSAALHDNTTGAQNAGLGAYTLHSNTVGSNNVAAGYQAMWSNTNGTNNAALGPNAGYNLTSGSNNIDISNEGSAGDNGTIKIGAASTQTQTFIAGIENSKITGAAVYVTSSGQLGVLASSRRYKTAIEPMGRKTRSLEQLRPVTFHLKSDPHGAVQYGLIAEEVEKIYPDLVIRDDAGQIQGVRYDELAPMLLSAVQQRKARLQAMKQMQEAQLHAMKQQIADLTEIVQTAMRQKQPAMPEVAMRRESSAALSVGTSRIE